MAKTRRERRAEAIEAIKKAVEDGGNYIDVFEVIDELYEIDYYNSTNVEDIEILLDLLSEDECTRVPHPKRTFGPVYTCSVCGYGVSDDRWVYCPKCGSLIDRSKHGQD